jgi:NAD(P)-dependent dehydrogenase (short-subunit alcohol dehydrogenase family)
VKAVLLGATRGMGRAVARRLVERGHEVFLLGRDPEQLARSARDLEIRRGAGAVGFARCDLLEPAGFAGALERADAALGGFDAVVLTAGVFDSQELLDQDPDACARLLTVDFTNSVLFCEAARRRLLARGGGRLCAFASVAGDRARRPVVLYGAAKAGLAHYLEGLDHRWRRDGLRTVCVKPGFVRTAMTAGLPEPPFAGDPEAVARRVVRALERGRPSVYVPAAWRLVMAVVRRLPRAVMRRASF